QDGLCVGVARLGLFLDIVEGVEDQQGLFQSLGGGGGQIGTVQQFDQGADVVAAQHGAQQFGGVCRIDQGTDLAAQGDGRQVGRLDACRLIHARWHAVGKEVQQERFLALGRVFQQFDQFGGLLSRQR